jgi:hypothetical protein
MCAAMRQDPGPRRGHKAKHKNYHNRKKAQLTKYLGTGGTTYRSIRDPLNSWAAKYYSFACGEGGPGLEQNPSRPMSAWVASTGINVEWVVESSWTGSHSLTHALDSLRSRIRAERMVLVDSQPSPARSLLGCVHIRQRSVDRL